MILKSMAVGPLQCNCIILGCEKTKEAIVVDPGDEGTRIWGEIEKLGLTPKFLIHTHAHFDHVGATQHLYDKTKCPTCLHKDDDWMYQNVPMQGKLFGMQLKAPPAIEKFIEDEEKLSFGDYSLKVLHTPGHSPGSVCFYVDAGDDSVVLSGDTLFQRSIGRTDLWGGDHGKILQSIKNRLFTLDEDLPVIPGHGDNTRLAEEKRENPFLV